MKKTYNFLRISLGLVYITYLVILLTCTPFYDLATFFVTLGFTTFAFAMMIILTFYKNTKSSMGLSIPMFSVSLIYLLIEFIMGIVFLIIVNSAEIFIKWKVHLYIQLPLFVIYAIGILLSHTLVKQIDVNIDNQVLVATSHKTIALQINKAAALSRSVKVRDQLDSLSLSIRFMDLSNDPTLQQVELEIVNEINQLNNSLSSSIDDTEITKMINKINSLVSRRNELSMIIKGARR